MHDPHLPLFRPEVTEARKQRVLGEIMLGQPVGTQALVLLIVGIIAALAAWVMLGTYTRTETARGILVTDLPTAKIVAQRPGVIASMPVREGDRVRAGQLLAIVRTEPSREQGGSNIADRLSAVSQQRRLADDQVRIAGLRASSERSRISAIIAGLRQQQSDLAGQISLQRQVVESSQEIFDRMAPVLDKGYVSRVDFERRRQAMLGARQQLAQLQQQSNSFAAEVRRTLAELARVNADTASTVVAAQSSAQSFAQQQAQLQSEREYALTAPIEGRLTAVQVAAGRAVDPSVPLMIIVPEGAALHAEVYAPTRAIGFVKPGQEVRLLFDAFPYQRFGSFQGRVTRVSRTVIDPRELTAPLKIEEAVYRIEVMPERQAVAAYGEKLSLQPGMTLNASLILDRRSFLDWLLQPLNAVTRRTRYYGDIGPGPRQERAS